MRSISKTTARLAIVLLFCGGFTWLSIASHRTEPVAKRLAQEFYAHHDHIIGTSLDLWITAPDEAAAEAAEKAILDEIERLRQIFSTYDAESELSRLNKTRAPFAASLEMMLVLSQYELWQERSQGAFNGQLGELVRVWKEAEKAGQEPDAATLSRIVHQLSQRGWQRDEANRTVTRLTDQPLNLNAIAKGFIIQQAADAARKKVPALQGLLLNLGGDMYVWGKNGLGETGWTIGVQNPLQPQDNAPPLAAVRLQDHAIATSGGYERYYTINGKRYSHLFDPRTGCSADGAVSATVIAKDNITANALATTLCVLKPEEGLRLVAALPGVECLLVTKEGKEHRSPGFGKLEITMLSATGNVMLQDKKEDKKEDKKAEPWPEGYQVNFTVTIPSVASKKYRRPYVAVWLENADAKPVRTITVWGNNPRWITELPQWWKFARNNNKLVTAVSRATRPPGKYSLVWDGKDDNGTALPQGTYTVYVEVHREHGKLVRQVGKLMCGTEPAQITLERNVETDATVVEYAKKKSP
jgi:FAD:protein FMN transferase